MVAKSSPREDPQSGMFDHVIEDADLEGAIGEWLAYSKARTEINAIAKRIRDAKERIGIGGMKDGDRVRCGKYTFEVKARSGGGFEMPEWSTVGYANMRSLVEPVDA